MIMTLIHGRIGSKKVIIAVSLRIPYFYAFRFGKNNGEGMIIVCSEFLLLLDESGGGEFLGDTYIRLLFRVIFYWTRIYIRCEELW